MRLLRPLPRFDSCMLVYSPFLYCFLPFRFPTSFPSPFSIPSPSEGPDHFQPLILLRSLVRWSSTAAFGCGVWSQDGFYCILHSKNTSCDHDWKWVSHQLTVNDYCIAVTKVLETLNLDSPWVTVTIMTGDLEWNCTLQINELTDIDWSVVSIINLVYAKDSFSRPLNQAPFPYCCHLPYQTW